MPRTIDLPFIGTPTQQTGFLAVTNFQTGRIGFSDLSTWVGVSLGIDQQVNIGASPSFANVTISQTGVMDALKVRRNISISDETPSSVQNASVYISNDRNDAAYRKATSIQFRGYSSNYAFGNKTYPVITAEYARGTKLQSAPVLKDDILLSFEVRGHDGAVFPDDPSGRFKFEANQPFGSTNNVTNKSGTVFNLASQPSDMQLGPGTLFSHIRNEWTTATTDSIIRNHIIIGDGGQGTAPELLTANGLTQVGHGSTNVFFINSQIRMFGVPNEALSGDVDNPSLKDTNKIMFLSSRGNAVAQRRQPLLPNDSLGRIDFRGTNITSSTNVGVTGGQIIYKAVDYFTTTTAGTKVLVSTINTGSFTESNRLDLANHLHVYNSENHVFVNNSGTVLATLSTAGFVVNVSATIVGSVLGGGIGGLGVRQTRTTSTSISSGTTATVQIVGFPSYMLSKMTINYPAWVRVYTDSTSRSNDASRDINTDPGQDSGVIVEVITTQSGVTKLFAPGILGFNNDAVTTNTVYLSVTNKDTVTRTYVIGMTLLQLES